MSDPSGCGAWRIVEVRRIVLPSQTRHLLSGRRATRLPPVERCPTGGRNRILTMGYVIMATMTDSVHLQAIVDEFLVDREALSIDDMRILWWSVFPSDLDGVSLALERFLELVTNSLEHEGLDFKLGAWRWDVTTNLANSMLSSLLVGGVLQSTGHLQWAGYTLPAVLAVLFKMERVRIESKDKVLVLILQERTRDDGLPRSVDELYGLLPKSERRVIAKSDFIALVERLRKAGKAAPDIGGTFRIVPEGKEPWIKIVLK